jgi:glycosyltransferase involved in cell wall biosynthesis
MEISVIVPTFNNRSVLEKTLEALQAQTFPAADYEIIVVDDGSTDGTAEMVAAMRGSAPIRYLSQTNLGRSAARNAGARAARGRILLFVDSDFWGTPGLLAEHHRHYPPEVRRRGVQGRWIVHADARVTPFMKTKEIARDLTLRRRRNLSPFHITTRNFSMLRADLEGIGGFDEGFSGYGWEDIELALRLHARGVIFEYEPRAVGYHHHVEDLEGTRRKLRQAGEGAVYFWRKHGRSFRIGLFLEIAPFLLPLKWLVYRTPLVMPLIRWVLPRAEAREWLLILNECYSNLLWEAYYEGVFGALRKSREMVRRESASGKSPHAESSPMEGVPGAAAHPEIVPWGIGESSGRGKAPRMGARSASGGGADPL